MPRENGRARSRFWTWLGAAGCILVTFVVSSVFGAAVWANRESLLRTVPDLWSVSDPVGPADAVVVLGGGIETRPLAAADYYHRGLVKKVLLSNVRISPMEPGHSETASNHRVLVNLGVPQEAIELFGAELSSTYEEAVALRNWALHTHAHTLIVPTEYFSSRRVHWIMMHEMAGSGTKVLVPALNYPEYSRSNWWKNERAVFEFKNELLKYIYYRLKY
jgi:hypothetical protein